ncbi:glycosyl hydrolase [Coccidioides immitis RS]|uniref:glycosyl hydrolase n=1 Tax=Coccidioides immitis (strain RS) TaxID=246410 RepID=UPI0000D8704A|nr:glycosyl hydrolase [Coccidioides immitis RS]EAS33518.3 glycosyl hydrolase [Coccidioides immitis RS]TPX21208.1 hypothetical protein DIZ76_015163 [Coccidioides immitis]
MGLLSNPRLWRGSFPLFLCAFFSVTFFLCDGITLAKPLHHAVGGQDDHLFLEGQQRPLARQQLAGPIDGLFSDDGSQKPLPEDPGETTGTLSWVLNAMSVMQTEYFVIWQAKWPSANDWTAAVMGTQISATLSAISSSINYLLSCTPGSTEAGGVDDSGPGSLKVLEYENLINYYFHQATAFWYGENFFGLRLQANDDMLWVVLEWLENIKFQNLHSDLHYPSPSNHKDPLLGSWHGNQFKIPAAHRSRVFYDLASKGWDTTLCGGGMIWSPWLVPYKNAVTNELFVSASIGMYLYFPGDTIREPVSTKTTFDDDWVSIPRNPAHLKAATTAYTWLKNSNMIGQNGLYADGFHISGWSEHSPGTGRCDVLNTMLYTYNQGIILSGLRGLWLATGSVAYLDDGHDLIAKVMKSTGWPDTHGRQWQGLGRGGVLEDACDSLGTCSQDSQTFKGIFFLHFAEFCRPLRPQEKLFLEKVVSHNVDDAHDGEGWEETFKLHQKRCASYGKWLKHNADAAYMTRNEEGKFGMWWGRKYPDQEPNPIETSVLPLGAVDYLDLNSTESDSDFLSPRRPGPDVLGSDRIRDLLKRNEVNEPMSSMDTKAHQADVRDVNDRGRGRTVETQAGAMAVFRALYQWETTPSLSFQGHNA